MRVVLQRVKQAQVEIDQQIVGQIKTGFLLLIGIQAGDTKEEADYLAQKISRVRIFEDENQKMNYSLAQVNGQVLAVSQFTLFADTKKGNRPSFTAAASPKEAEALYEYFIEALKQLNIPVATGRFGADMQVSLINDGPVTLIYDTKE